MSDEIEELRREVARLRVELGEREREAAQRAAELRSCTAQLRRASELERVHSIELRRSCESTVRALADAVEARDAYTGKHAERVAAYGLTLARACGLPVEEPQIEFGFLLHDIGKVAISDAILHKPGTLTGPERDVMRQHPVIGDEIVSGIDFLGDARHVVRSHHERWDGAGYPDRLAGDGIPLAARVFAVADTFDALTSDRPYRAAASIAAARSVIAEGAGSQFDPDVAATFATIPDEAFSEIHLSLA
ncbi:MAG TPA: HD domain-containing phosphohydrolase [Conexibacter sp.]